MIPALFQNVANVNLIIIQLMVLDGNMQMNKMSYKLYPTLLDAYQNFIDSDKIYHKYYGFSDNPPCDEDEFKEQQFQALIDKINRVPFDSEAADKGTCFNEIVDSIIEGRKPKRMEVERSEDNTSYLVTFNERKFVFPIGVCREFADYYKGALTQQYVEAILPTAYGDVLVYGFIDELMPDSVHDIKTTGSYSVGKFKDHHQHLVYPYALLQSGSDVRTFEYNVAEFNKGGYVTGTYTETYVFNPERDIPILRDHCEEFIRFLEENRELITDIKIFGGK